MRNLLHTPRGRAVLFGLLYASEGAPIGFIWWSLPTLLREQGGEVGRITSVLAAVTAMWALKFLWAPLVDILRSRRWGFRSWILAAQALMGGALLPLVWLDPVADLQWVLGLLIAHALCATIQDVAIDALAINVVARGELGRINGFMAAGKYIGRGLFGGLALVVAARFGWTWIIIGMVGWIWGILLVVRTLPEEAGLEDASAGQRQTRGALQDFIRSLQTLARTRLTWLALGFALLAGAGFEGVGMLAGTFLPDRGMSVEAVGWFRTFVVLGAMIAGGLLGGLLTDRLGVRAASATFLLVLTAGTAGLSVADSLNGTLPWLLVWIGFLYFGYGLFVAASYALFMSVTTHRVAGTQFSLFMAATNGCEVWSGWAGGQIVERTGYAAAFLTLGAVSLLALPLLAGMRPPALRGSQRRDSSPPPE